MKNLIGGLFETQEMANQAYQALQESGFTREQINVLVQKPRNRTIRSMNVKIQDIAKNAILGGFVIGAIGGFIGWLVGVGIIVLPGFEPAAANPNPFYTANSIASGLILGGLTGIILGVVYKLLRSQEKAEVVTRKIKQGGVLVTVNAGNSQSESRARRVIEEKGAIEVGNPAEKWDLNAWVNPNENPSLANAR